MLQKALKSDLKTRLREIKKFLPHPCVTSAIRAGVAYWGRLCPPFCLPPKINLLHALGKREEKWEKGEEQVLLKRW